jgi:hypothetical protein
MRLGVRSTLGMLFLGFAAILLLGEVLMLAYPAGVQPAGGADPSGSPPGWRMHATWLGVIVALSAAGGWLMFGGRPKRNTPRHQRDRG